MSRKKILLTLLSALVVGNVSALQNELVNPGFEKWQGNIPVGWELYSPNSHHKAEVKEVHGGSIAVVAEHHKDTPEFGLLQKIVYEKPTTKPILFGGWSKSAGITRQDDYNIFLDITYADGTNAYAIKSYWSNGSSNWRHTFSCFRPEKPVAQINYYIFLRKGAAGKAYFDDFELYRGEPDVQIGTVEVESTAPVVKDGLFISTEFFRELSYKAVLKDADGKELLSQSGTGWGIRWDAAPPRKAAELEIQVSMGSKHKAYTCPINVNSELPENPVKGTYQIWTADSMTNISPVTYPAAEASCDVSLELAKAEAESAQIQVTAGAEPLAEVNVVLPELKNDAGETFPGEIKWERVGYVRRAGPYALHPNGFPDQEVWLPDPLLPAREFRVPANATQGIWLTVRADRKAKAGVYRGDMTIVIDERKESVPISVRVFDFALPETFSLRSAFCIMDNFLFKAYPGRDQNELRREGWDIMLDHRLNPDDITRTTEPRIEDLLYARSRGMNQFNIFNLVPKPKDNPLWVLRCPVSVYNDELLEEFKARLDPYVEELRKHDLLKYAYVYGFDEVYEEHYPVIDRIGKELHKRYPGLPLMTTARNYRDLRKNPQRTDCRIADWFCPVTSDHDDTLSKQLRREGHQVWWYVCCAPEYPYANFATIEYPFIEGRLLAWQTFQHRADGLLYWHVNLWTNECYFDESVCYQPYFKLANFTFTHFSGDGQLLYPGATGPLPSIRLANIRDGSEDYDYLSLYGDKGRDFCRELSPTMTDYTRDPARLRAVRRQIAEELEKRK